MNGSLTARILLLAGLFTIDSVTLAAAKTLGNPSTSACGNGYIVSSNGSDDNPGTFAAPFATLARAQKAMRGGSIKTTCIRGGTYTTPTIVSDKPYMLYLTSSDSGQTWKSYPGEKAVISGGKQITGWALHDVNRNIYRAPVGIGWKFRQLYVNELHANRTMGFDHSNVWVISLGHARSLSPPSGWSVTSTGLVAPNDMLASYNNPSSLDVVIDSYWRRSYCKVFSIEGRNITMSQPCWARILGQNGQLDRRQWPTWIGNAYELLVKPGSWYLDANKGLVYYIPLTGLKIANAKIHAPLIQDLVYADGVKKLTFERLSFEYSNWTGLDRDGLGYVSHSQAGYLFGVNGTMGPMPSALTFKASTNITFQHCLFSHLGSRALAFLEGGNQHIRVEANKFIDNAGGALQYGVITDNSNKDLTTQSLYATISNNYIGPSFDYPDNSEIFIANAGNVVVSNNEFVGAGWNSVSLGWGWGASNYSRKNKISSNRINASNQIFPDGAAIYTLGPQPGTIISNNYIVMNGSVGFGCLYPDEGTSGTRWVNNVCESASYWLFIHAPSIRGNAFADNWTTTPKARLDGTQMTLMNNRSFVSGDRPSPAQSIINNAGILPLVTPGP